MYNNIALWASVAIVEVSHDAAFTKGVQTFCNSCSIDKVTFADGTQDVGGQLCEVYHTLQTKIGEFEYTV